MLYRIGKTHCVLSLLPGTSYLTSWPTRTRRSTTYSSRSERHVLCFVLRDGCEVRPLQVIMYRYCGVVCEAHGAGFLPRLVSRSLSCKFVKLKYLQSDVVCRRQGAFLADKYYTINLAHVHTKHRSQSRSMPPSVRRTVLTQARYAEYQWAMASWLTGVYSTENIYHKGKLTRMSNTNTTGT